MHAMLAEGFPLSQIKYNITWRKMARKILKSMEIKTAVWKKMIGVVLKVILFLLFICLC